MDAPSSSVGDYTPSLSTTPMSISQSSFQLNAMRARIAELEDKLSRATSTTSSVYTPSASTPASTHAVHTVSSFACTVDVLQDTQIPGGADISRGIATDVNEQAERAQPIGLLSQLSGGQQLARLARIG
ncbi:hypothetical protein PtrCC142_012077 [Pyrenophora tritici-repentis]|nr:hypothetical protein Alg215_12125 [Pyrenophora tritici-repentis]KAI1521804.1 hypothetical protein PtrSN001C_012089 [Pyrenophora tritici-repentis]KAI1521844.1 hypothetical protein PtrSN001A_011996 [Pyrenophora tritici-repentis]KAI1558478.1 hypothetical protein PtrEW4_012018 [Pyrenophora tritici-repentis]KAI1588418.1 hypothetical protein PtrCC142_012077 [Pyrenophora tritici-repentis]